MTDKQIYSLASTFRSAIESARDAGDFKDDFSFYHFPRACCGDASYLLAEYLYRCGIETIWTSMERNGSHAWLVVKDKRVKEPTPKSFSWPEELRVVIAGYGVEEPEKEIDVTHYEEDDLKDGLIIDITADQFPDYDIPVYVGTMDSFHKKYEFIQAHDFRGMGTARLESLYSKIEKWI